MTSYLENKLRAREKEGNLRHLTVTKNLIDFSSNDYLGLARSPGLAASVLQECSRQVHPLNGLGSTGSRLLTGNSRYAEDLENSIAAFHGYEAGLLFGCGYMANLGLLSTIGDKNDIIFFDVGVHASTHDGMRLSQAKAFPFRHNDIEHLEKRLKNCSTQGNRFICIESIYSTDGSKAPLLEICQLSNKYEALLIVDEAHAVGVCGTNGSGLVTELKLTSSVYAQVVTFGKALGTYGAIVLGSHLLKKALINFSTSYIYTTALPYHALAAIKCSYDLFPTLTREREHLQKLIRIFREEYLNSSETHIQSIPILENVQKRFDVRPLRSPTVQKGKEILRVCLHAFNTESELRELLQCIKS